MTGAALPRAPRCAWPARTRGPGLAWLPPHSQQSHGHVSLCWALGAHVSRAGWEQARPGPLPAGCAVPPGGGGGRLERAGPAGQGPRTVTAEPLGPVSKAPSRNTVDRDTTTHETRLQRKRREGHGGFASVPMFIPTQPSAETAQSQTCRTTRTAGGSLGPSQERPRPGAEGPTGSLRGGRPHLWGSLGVTVWTQAEWGWRRSRASGQRQQGFAGTRSWSVGGPREGVPATQGPSRHL